MRISTSEFYSSSVQAADSQQAQLLQLEDEISSGSSLTSPADNPLGAAQAVQLSATTATYSQYSTNQSAALSSLQLEDSTLQSVTTTLQSISSLMQEASSGTVNATNLSSMAEQMQGDLNQLVTLANTTDGSGNYLFGGYETTSQPFTTEADGSIAYNGDSGQPEIQISGTQQVAISDAGSSVFMSVPSVGTSPVSAGSSSNTGTGTIGQVSVTDPSASTNNDSYSIAFADTGTPPSLTYTVTDTTTGTAIATNQAYTSGTSISLGSGMNVAISGTPAAGDQFTVTPASDPANSNVFQTIQNVIDALQSPDATTSAGEASTNLTNALTTGMTAISNSLSNVTTINAAVGGREQEVEAMQTVTTANSTQSQTALTNLTSTDMVSAISQYEQVQNSLTASLESFASSQGLSLFKYIQT